MNMTADKILSGEQVISWCDLLQRQIGARHKDHKRCGEYLYYIDGMKSELGCTRRKGHAGNHRIRVRVIGRLGRKHYSWPNVKYLVAFALAE